MGFKCPICGAEVNTKASTEENESFAITMADLGEKGMFNPGKGAYVDMYLCTSCGYLSLFMHGKVPPSQRKG
jgi:rubrerythrin